MQSFEKTLGFFKAKESPSLHKFVLQKMSSQLAAERQEIMKARAEAAAAKAASRKNMPPAAVTCVSKRLFETPVSRAIQRWQAGTKHLLPTAPEQLLHLPIVPQLLPLHPDLHVEV